MPCLDLLLCSSRSCCSNFSFAEASLACRIAISSCVITFIDSAECGGIWCGFFGAVGAVGGGGGGFAFLVLGQKSSRDCRIGTSTSSVCWSCCSLLSLVGSYTCLRWIVGGWYSVVHVHGSALGKKGIAFSGCVRSNCSHFLWRDGQLLSQLVCLSPWSLHETHFLFWELQSSVLCILLAQLPHVSYVTVNTFPGNVVVFLAFEASYGLFLAFLNVNPLTVYHKSITYYLVCFFSIAHDEDEVCIVLLLSFVTMGDRLGPPYPFKVIGMEVVSLQHLVNMLPVICFKVDWDIVCNKIVGLCLVLCSCTTLT